MEQLMFEAQMTSMDLELPMTFESEAITLNDTAEVIVASEAGAFSCADVWFHVPEDWLSRVTVRLYARLGSIRVLVRQVVLQTAPHTEGAGGAQSGIALSVRGRPCTGFDVTCQASAGDTLVDGLVYLQAWHSNGRELMT